MIEISGKDTVIIASMKPCKLCGGAGILNAEPWKPWGLETGQTEYFVSCERCVADGAHYPTGKCASGHVITRQEARGRAVQTWNEGTYHQDQKREIEKWMKRK